MIKFKLQNHLDIHHMKAIDMVDQELRSCLILISRQHLGYYCVNNQKCYNCGVYLVILTVLISHVTAASIVSQFYPLASGHGRLDHLYIQQTITGNVLQTKY